MIIRNTAVKAKRIQLWQLNIPQYFMMKISTSPEHYVVLRLHPRGEARGTVVLLLVLEGCRARTKYSLTIINSMKSARVPWHALRLNQAERWYQY